MATSTPHGLQIRTQASGINGRLSEKEPLLLKCSAAEKGCIIRESAYALVAFRAGYPVIDIDQENAD